jgi:Uma2 family endonuclease
MARMEAGAEEAAIESPLPPLRYILPAMNAPRTRAAEGLPRRAFTVKDVERMAEIGLISDDERVELLGGEIVPMSPKGIRHELLKEALLRRWYRSAPDALRIIPETTFRLGGDTFLEPDILVFPKASPLSGLTAERALLAVEIAESSLGYDLGAKAVIYARFGLPELWVIDAVRLVTHVHRDPRSTGYRTVAAIPADMRLTPAAVPELTVALADLDLSD